MSGHFSTLCMKGLIGDYYTKSNWSFDIWKKIWLLTIFWIIFAELYFWKTRHVSEPTRPSKIEFFAKVVNEWKPLDIQLGSKYVCESNVLSEKMSVQGYQSVENIFEKFLK